MPRQISSHQRQQNKSSWYNILKSAVGTIQYKQLSGSLNSNTLMMYTNTAVRKRETVLSKTVQTGSEEQFVLTAYALDKACTGKAPGMADFGITASGIPAEVGRTVAVDPSVIPYGTRIFIAGLGWRIAEDTGGAIKGHHIDVLVSSYHAAIEFGVKRHAAVRVFRHVQPMAK